MGIKVCISNEALVAFFAIEFVIRMFVAMRLKLTLEVK